MKLTQIKIQINTLGSPKESSLFPKVAKAQLGMFYEEAGRPAMRTGASVQVLVALGAEHLLRSFQGCKLPTPGRLFMSPKRKRGVSLWTCGHCTFSVCWLTLVLGAAHQQKCGGFFPRILSSCSAAESSAGSRGRASQTLVGLPRGSPTEVPAGLGSAELDSE